MAVPRLSIVVLAAVAALAGGLVAPSSRAADEPVPIADVRRMSAETLASCPEVTVRGTVIRVGKRQGSCIVQDDTDGLYVGLGGEDGIAWQDWPDGRPTAATFAPGAVVEVTGRIKSGGFSPVLIATVVRLRGTAPLPEPRTVDATGFFAGAYDSTLVEVQGVVQAVMQTRLSWRITLAACGRSVTVDVAKSATDVDPREVVDGEVRVRGPSVSIFNARGEFLAPWVTVNRPGGFTVVSPPPQPPFESPAVPLGSLAGFRADVDRGHMVRIEGTVIHVVPRTSIFLLEGHRGVRVLTAATGDVATGDRVAAAGFIDRSGPVARLAHALVRRVASGPPPEPAEIGPAAILAINAVATRTAYQATPSDYEGALIRFPARLLDVHEEADGGLLALATDDATVTATVGPDAFQDLRSLALGSDVLVTGIANIEWDFNPVVWPARTPRAVRLLIRSAADVAVVRVPSWWTPRRLALLAGGIALGLATALAWAWSLRREVARQRGIAARELRERQAADAIARDRELRAEQRQRQELKAKLEASLTAAAIAHEIKLPLSHMVLGSKLAVDTLATMGREGEPLRPVLSGLVRESERVVSTIERMRVLLRSVQTDHGPVDLADVVRNAVLHASRDLERLGVAITVRGADGPCTIDGDTGQLQIALGNLLRNAAEALAARPADARRIDVEVAAGAAPGDGPAGFVEVVVGDSGPGFVDLAAVTAPLTSTKPGGTGVGLFVVRTVVENHGGTVAFGSSPLGGAEVRCRFPRGLPTAGAPALEPS